LIVTIFEGFIVIIGRQEAGGGGRGEEEIRINASEWGFGNLGRWGEFLLDG
jgi:hypothetical protein